MPPKRKLNKNSMELLLKAAEGGSPKHIEALREAWPEDIASATRALTFLLKHLDANNIPVLWDGWDSRDQADAHRALVIRASLNTLDAAFDYMEGLKWDHLNQLLRIFQERLVDLLAALEFLTKYSSGIMADQADEFDTKHFGDLCAAKYLCRLVIYGAKLYEQEEGLTSLEMIVSHLLKGWLRSLEGAPPANRTTMSPADYKFWGPLHKGLFQCISEMSTTSLLWKAVVSLDERTMKQFAESFSYRCVEWATIHRPTRKEDVRNMNCSDLVDLISGACQIAILPTFDRALLKSGFYSLAMKLAMEFRDARTMRACGGSVATEIASHLLPTKNARAFTLVHTLPTLLDGGLLEVIFIDLLAMGPADSDSASRWFGDEPMLSIFRACHHPRIYGALDSAERILPEWTKSLIEADPDPAVREVYSTFMKSVHLYKGASGEAYHAGFPFNCACLDHHQGREVVMSSAYQCSRCKTVVYCSPRCQRTDWEGLHREECITKRAHRIESELAGAWLSHREQMRYIYALKTSFLENVVDDILPSIPHPKRGIQVMSPTTPVPIFLTITSQMPVINETCSPIELFQLEENGRTLFSDARFHAIVNVVQGLESTSFIALVASLSRLGDYLVCALGAFLLEREELGSGGRESSNSVGLELWNGHVQIVGPMY